MFLQDVLNVLVFRGLFLKSIPLCYLAFHFLFVFPVIFPLGEFSCCFDSQFTIVSHGLLFIIGIDLSIHLFSLFLAVKKTHQFVSMGPSQAHCSLIK